MWCLGLFSGLGIEVRSKNMNAVWDGTFSTYFGSVKIEDILYLGIYLLSIGMGYIYWG